MVQLPVKRTTGATLKERLTPNAYGHILPARYLQKDEQGRVIESPEEMFRRVAENVAQPEDMVGGDASETAETFYEVMTNLAFIPNSPTLMNAGVEFQQLAACFVISPEDDLNSIFETLRKAANILQTGGGVGYTFTELRPKGDVVHSTGGTASGPVSFMHVYDEMCGTLKQGGRRRGAQMAILRVDHPDVGRFATAKRREGVLSNFNISVAITETFVETVRQGTDYTLYNPRTGEPFEVREQTAQFYSTAYEDVDTNVVEENIWRDHAAEIEGLDQYRGETDLSIGEPMKLPAGFIWRMIVDGAWRNGEPGLFMIDQANADHSFDVEAHPEHAIAATNPCGEEPLEEYEACSLGHINLSLMVAQDRPYWPDFRAAHDGPLPTIVADFLEKAVDWERLKSVARIGTKFLDDAVTVSEFPLGEIDEKQKGMRNIGLGILGLAEMLIQMRIPYGSEASFEVARQLMRAITRESKLVSHELAEERGAFEGWEDSKFARPTAYPDWFRRHTGLDPEAWSQGLKLRNHHTTMIAPTGTTSMIANTSAGAEPLFDVVYFKDVSEDVQGEEMLVEFNDYFLRVLQANGIEVEDVRAEAQELMRKGEYEGPHSLSIPEEIREVFPTARQIAPEDHVRMQAALQEHVDGAISKTINFPQDAKHAEVGKAYELAVDLGCKGLTIYRMGSRQEQVLRRDERPRHLEGAEDFLEAVSQQFGSLETFCDEVVHGEEVLRCPKCGAPLTQDGQRASTACPECGTIDRSHKQVT